MNLSILSGVIVGGYFSSCDFCPGWTDIHATSRVIFALDHRGCSSMTRWSNGFTERNAITVVINVYRQIPRTGVRQRIEPGEEGESSPPADHRNLSGFYFTVAFANSSAPGSVAIACTSAKSLSFSSSLARRYGHGASTLL